MQCSQVSSRGRGAIFWGTEPAAALCFLTVSPHHSLELRVQTIAPWLDAGPCHVGPTMAQLTLWQLASSEQVRGPSEGGKGRNRVFL